ncbi:hypothetical protein ACFSTD_09975 [Novosphingobium colocasiae]
MAIIVAVKHRRNGKEAKRLAEVHHGDLWGDRENKGRALWAGAMPTLAATILPHKAPSYPFVPRDYEVESKYSKGFFRGRIDVR